MLVLLLCVVNRTSTPKGESLNFSVLGSVKNSFTRLSDRVSKLLQKEEFFSLKLNCERAVIDAQLPEYFCNKLKSSGNFNELLSVLIFSPYWNWIDVRLMEAVAVISDEAIYMLKQYKEYLHPQYLVDHLSLITDIQADIKVNYKAATIKMQTKIDKITIKHFFSLRHFIETQILDLKEGNCILRNTEDSFEINWFIPRDQCLHACKSAEKNLMHFYKFSLLSVHIESYDIISLITLQVCTLSMIMS